MNNEQLTDLIQKLDAVFAARKRYEEADRRYREIVAERKEKKHEKGKGF